MIKRKETGFTMIELLVVSTIIIVLTAIGMISYQSISVKSRNAKRRADLETVRQALTLYKADEGSYPIAVAESNRSVAVGSFATNKSENSFLQKLTDSELADFSLVEEAFAAYGGASGTSTEFDSMMGDLVSQNYIDNSNISDPKPSATYFYDYTSAAGTSFSLCAFDEPDGVQFCLSNL